MVRREHPIRVEDRTGDTKTSARQRQRTDPPQILLTTPESLALMLSYPEAPKIFGSLRRVVLDELHALAEADPAEVEEIRRRSAAAPQEG